MKLRWAWLAGAVLLALGWAAWALRSAPAPSADSPQEKISLETPSPAHVESQPAAATTPGVLDNTLPLGPKPRRTDGPPRIVHVPQRPPRPGEKQIDLIAKLFTPAGTKSRPEEVEFWDQSPVREYVFPADHPCAGQPRPGVSAATLADAGDAALAPVIGHLPDVDLPQCYMPGNWPYHPLNACAKSLDRTNPASVQAFIACLDAVPQDPGAYRAEIWVPCPPDNPRATTVRKQLETLVKAHAEEMVAAPPCQVE